MMQADGVLANVRRRYDDLPADQIRMRSVPTEASAERARSNGNLPWRDELERHVRDADVNVEQNFSTPPEEFMTQRPATGDYYEVKSGDRVYGYLPNSASRNESYELVRHSREYVNQLTGRDDAYIQNRAGEPVQVRANNGVPMWEVYERESGHVVHTFADHDQTSAWQQGQSYLRSIGAEDPSLFSVRPKMSA
jgi:hypothetical protein